MTMVSDYLEILTFLFWSPFNGIRLSKRVYNEVKALLSSIREMPSGKFFKEKKRKEKKRKKENQLVTSRNAQIQPHPGNNYQ